MSTLEVKAIQAPTGHNLSMPAGAILQVIRAETSTEVNLSSSTYTDLGLSATITPKFSSSKILVFWSVHSRIKTTEGGFGSKLIRGSTAVWTSGASFFVYGNFVDERHSTEFKYLDSPNTTSATTYKIQVATHDGKQVLFSANGNQASILLMEVAG